MSLVIELERGGRKAGHVCDPSYRRGRNCPLILRQTSEDVVTANVFGILRRMPPALWLRPLLNQAFRTKHFRACSLTGLEVSFWHTVAPPAGRAHMEGFTEVDVLIRARELVVFIEAKYRAQLSTRTTEDESRDQVIRLLDVAFEMAMASQLFTRVPYVLVLGATPTEPELVTRYRSATAVDQALVTRHNHPDHRAIAELLSTRLGYASWQELATIIEAHLEDAGRTERLLLGDVVDYIRLKMATVHMTSEARRQMVLPELEDGQLAEDER